MRRSRRLDAEEDTARTTSMAEAERVEDGQLEGE